MAEKRGIRVNALAKELGVESKSILHKLKEEGLADAAPNHMSMISTGLAESVREWFVTEESRNAIDPAEVIETSDAKPKPSRTRKKKDEDAPITQVGATSGGESSRTAFETTFDAHKAHPVMRAYLHELDRCSHERQRLLQGSASPLRIRVLDDSIQRLHVLMTELHARLNEDPTTSALSRRTISHLAIELSPPPLHCARPDELCTVVSALGRRTAVIVGKPGCGRTTLAAFAAAEMQRHAKANVFLPFRFVHPNHLAVNGADGGYAMGVVSLVQTVREASMVGLVLSDAHDCADPRCSSQDAVDAWTHSLAELIDARIPLVLLTTDAGLSFLRTQWRGLITSSTVLKLADLPETQLVLVIRERMQHLAMGQPFYFDDRFDMELLKAARLSESKYCEPLRSLRLLERAITGFHRVEARIKGLTHEDYKARLALQGRKCIRSEYLSEYLQLGAERAS